MTSAIERLRALLDERGVEWRGGLPTETMVEADGLDLLYVALPDGRVRAFIRNYLTPEQAVEATLGSDLQAENAKLRELVRDYERCSVHADCGLCEYDGKLSTHCPLSPCFPDADELCELRIEVDE